MSEAAGSIIWAEQEQEQESALSPHPYRSNLWLLTTPKLPKNAVIVTCYLLPCGVWTLDTENMDNTSLTGLLTSDQNAVPRPLQLNSLRLSYF